MLDIQCKTYECSCFDDDVLVRYPYECSCFDDDVKQLKHINIE